MILPGAAGTRRDRPSGEPLGTAAQLADLPMVLGPCARHRRIPNPGVADLGEVCMADPEMGAVNSSSEARVPHTDDDWEAWGDAFDWRDLLIIALGIVTVSAPIWLLVLGSLVLR